MARDICQWSSSESPLVHYCTSTRVIVVSKVRGDKTQDPGTISEQGARGQDTGPWYNQ